MVKIKIESALYQRAQKAASENGYSSVDEFVSHAIEESLQRRESEVAEQRVAEQLRGLGYIQ